MDQAAIEASKARSALKRDAHERQRAMDRELKEFHGRRVQQMVRDVGVRFVHVRDFDYKAQSLAHQGGITVVWHYEGGPNRIVAAIAQCNPKDRYCKWMGRHTACRAMREGNSIVFTVPKNTTPNDVLRQMFNQLLPRKY